MIVRTSHMKPTSEAYAYLFWLGLNYHPYTRGFIIMLWLVLYHIVFTFSKVFELRGGGQWF